VDICGWGAGLAVTGRIRKIGQNLLQSSFKEEVVGAAPVTATFASLSLSSSSSLEIYYNNYTMNSLYNNNYKVH
jgi:hypothetical protein